MKTISKHDGKNYEIEVKGDLHEYPDGTIFEVKDGKLIPGKGGGLPDASAYEDGTALIAVDGKFVPAKGYGYLGTETILSWDFIYRAGEDTSFLVDSQTLIVMHKWYDGHLSQDEIAVSADIGYSGITKHLDSLFNKRNESETRVIYGDHDSSGEMLSIYDVLNEAFWTQQGRESLGTGLFIVCNILKASVSDGEFVLDGMGLDSVNVTAKLCDGRITIDPELLPDTALKLVTVSDLPGRGEKNTIYLVPNYSAEYANYYDEYVWVSETQEFEKFGGIEVNLSDYVTHSALSSTLSGYVTYSDMNTALNSYVAKNMITSGTAEYEDGVTSLETGKLYFQYEV